jgi:hypothetical protein
MSIKHLAIVFPFLSCLVTGSLLAGNTQDPNDQISESNLRNEKQPKSRSDSVFNGFTMDGSFLYWNAKADGYGFAYKTRIKGGSGGVPTMIKGDLDFEAPSFGSWDPGFQIAIGYVISQRQQWHTRLAWTRFNTSSDTSLSTSSIDLTKHLTPLLFPILTGPLADRAKAHFSLNFNTLDLDLGRQFFVGKWLSLAPKVGVRAAWIDQDFKVNYRSYFPTSSTIFIENTSFKADQNFSGIGLKFGSDIEFYFAKSWSILGNVSGSLLMGHININEKIAGLIVIDPLVAIPEKVKIKNSIHRIRSNLEGQLGLQWQTYFYKNRFRFACAALYSFAYWFNQNNLIDVSTTFSPGLSEPVVNDISQSQDLQLQGLNIKLGIDF